MQGRDVEEGNRSRPRFIGEKKRKISTIKPSR